jgi:hypothetical protein
MKKIFYLPLFLLISLFSLKAEAAILYLAPETGTFQIGNTFSVSVKVNAQGTPINAGDGIINFSPDELEVVSISKTGSIFTLWPQEPTFSSKTGKIEFAGGSPQAFSGTSGQILTIVFRGKRETVAKVNFSSGSILAADGKGTNVISEMRGGTYILRAKETLPPAEEYIAQPGTPKAPKITSPTHPDPEKWYSNNNPIFRWELPPDVKAVRILVDKNPSSIPTVYYSPPISEKKLENFEEGVWYFHCQLQNDKGWGSAGHFKFKIDVTPPEKFEISVKEGEKIFTTTPTLVFKTEDKVSGIDFYEVRIGNLEPVRTKEGEYRTPTLTPGKYNVVVRAVDFAGNETIGIKEIEIIPLPAPKITYWQKELKPKEYLLLKGESNPEAEIEVFLQKRGGEAEIEKTFADSEGRWELVWPKALDEGIYQVWARAKDKTGGESEISEKITVKVSPPPFIKIGELAINYLSILITLIGLLAILILIVFFTWLKIRQWRERLRGEAREAAKSLVEGFRVMEGEIREEISRLDKKPGLSEEEEKIYQKLKEILEKTRKTIGKEIEDIEKILRLK